MTTLKIEELRRIVEEKLCNKRTMSDCALDLAIYGTTFVKIENDGSVKRVPATVSNTWTVVPIDPDAFPITIDELKKRIE